MSDEPKTAAEALGWLKSFAPDGRCKRCGLPLPPGRRFQHTECDELSRAELRELDGQRQPPPTAGPRELAEVHDESLVDGRAALDADDFPRPDRWSSEVYARLLRWTPDSPGVWLAGSVGSGKTTLLVGLALRLRREGVAVCCTGYQYLLDALRAAMGRDPARYHELLDGLGAVDVLALDDALLRPPTAWERQLLYQVLNARMNRRLPLLVASNHGFDHAARILVGEGEEGDLGQRIVSRLRVTAPVALELHYPGDRRTGDYSEAQARILATMQGARR